MATQYDISDLYVIRETEKAILVEVPVGYCHLQSHEHWIPKSQITTQPNSNPCFADEQLIPYWLASKIGIA